MTTIAVGQPQLWDVDSPRLYTAVTRVFLAGKLVDSTSTPCGMRTFVFSADDGFHLNGRRVQLKGVCLHSDLGPLGMAFNTRAMERELQIMQEMGVNAIRTSHNPPAPELFLNGRSLGRRTKNPNAEVVRDRYALRWLDVPYAPGQLKAVAYRNGRQLGTAVMRTAGEPASLRLTPDLRALTADGDDLSYLLVEAVDRDGNLCPLAMNKVQFRLEGPATIAGVGNGDHHYPAEFDADQVTLFYGKAMLIVRANEVKGGGIRVTAASDGLREAKVSLRSRPTKSTTAPPNSG